MIARCGGEMCMIITTHLVPYMQDMSDDQAEAPGPCRTGHRREAFFDTIDGKTSIAQYIKLQCRAVQNVSPGTILSPPSRSNQLSRPVVIPPNSARRGTTVLHPCANAHASLP